MTNKYSLGVRGKIVSIACLMLVASSCSSAIDPKQELTSYCIRECVIETSASEICDTDCKCATEKLSSEYSEEDFVNLVQSIKQEKADSVAVLTSSLESCKDSTK